MTFTDWWFLDYLGWLGGLSLAVFYWELGKGNVLRAYIFNIIGSSAWLVVGVLTYFGFASDLPSLIATEAMFIVLAIKGIIFWRKEAKA